MVYATVISSKLAQYLFDKVEPFFAEHQLDYTQVVMYEVVLDDEDLAELFYSPGRRDKFSPQLPTNTSRINRYVALEDIGDTHRAEAGDFCRCFCSHFPQILKTNSDIYGEHT